MESFLNVGLMKAPLNWVLVTVVAGFGFLAASVVFPELFIPNHKRKM